MRNDLPPVGQTLGNSGYVEQLERAAELQRTGRTFGEEYDRICKQLWERHEKRPRPTKAEREEFDNMSPAH